MKRHIVLVTTLLWALGTGVFAQEHPEHPKKDELKKQPPEKVEQADRSESTKEMTLDALADAITDYIEHDSKLKGGFFLVYDTQEKKPLQLELVKVHKERLSSLGNGVYFACTDMKASHAVVYDLDFFMKQTGDGLETTEITVHKKAGKPRYNWKEENGIWKKVKVEA